MSRRAAAAIWLGSPAAGASQFTFHIEAPGIDFDCGKAAALCQQARQAGMLAGIALTPETGTEAVFPLCQAGAVDTVLLLSVRAGATACCCCRYCYRCR